MIHYSECPLCGSQNINQLFIIKDHSVTKEEFPVWGCTDCQLYFTQDIPLENEIGKYYQSEAYISHSDTNEGLINKLYHRIRDFTLKQKRNLIRKECGIRTGSLLDIGSGTGAFLHTMQSAGWEVTGLEPDETARENSEKLNHVKALKPGEIINLQTSSFDSITMWHVLEHVHKLHDQMQNLHRLLKPNGRIFIAVPNHTSSDADHYKAFWAAWDVPRHLYHFSPGSMIVLAEKYGFEIIRYKPMWFDSFYVSMLSEKYKPGKSHILRAFCTGLLSNIKAWANVKRCSSVIYILRKSG